MNIKSRSARVISLLSYISFISKKNAIIVKDFDYKSWEKEINNILENKYDITTIQKNAFNTASEFTWVKRVSKILNKN